MSADEHLSERDKAILDQAAHNGSGEVAQFEDPDDDLEERVSSLEDTVSKLVDALGETQAELEQERAKKRDLAAKINQLQAQVEGDHDLVGTTTLEKYSSMAPEDQEDLLSTSERRAVSIYENWDDLSWRAGGRDGTFLLETQARANAKNNPSKIKYRLENHFNQDLAWNEVYRAMKAVAKLSGGEEDKDGSGRLSITGGDFEYHVLPTADNSRTRRILKRVDA